MGRRDTKDASQTQAWGSIETVDFLFIFSTSTEETDKDYAKVSNHEHSKVLKSSHFQLLPNKVKIIF